MSTGPRPSSSGGTPEKASAPSSDDSSRGASLEEIADLLIEEEDHASTALTPLPVNASAKRSGEEGLDVVLETPGPVLSSTFMPPPPAPIGTVSEDSDNGEDTGAATNLAYEDLLAKLVLPVSSPEPDSAPKLPEPTSTTPIPIPAIVAEAKADRAREPAYSSGISSPSIQVAPPTEERTLVTENPLVAEEQQAAVREGRVTPVREHPRVVREEMRAAVTERMAAGSRAHGPSLPHPRSKLLYGICFLGGMVVATVFFKLLTSSSPAPQPPAEPPRAVPQPTPAPPAVVEPLPPSPAAAPAAALPAAAAAPAPSELPPPAAPPASPPPPAAKAAAAEEVPALDEGAPAEEEHASAHRREHKPTHVAAARPAAAARPSVQHSPAGPGTKPKVATAAATPAASGASAKASKSGKPGRPGKGKSTGYADPFDN
jgi:hypothetical protein